MTKAIELVKKISGDLSKEWKEELWEYNMPQAFLNIYSITDLENANRIICFIPYAYSPESLWLDLRKDRIENKTTILNNIGADPKSELFQEILYNKNEIINMAVFDYLEGLKSWKWKFIFDLLDWSSRMSRFATQETESEKSWDKLNAEGQKETFTKDIQIETISKVNREKGLLLDQAFLKRKQADTLLDEIRKEFVITDNATQSDFQFTFTESAKKRDILSWREWIVSKNENKKAALS